jgi:hypothetical protein
VVRRSIPGNLRRCPKRPVRLINFPTLLPLEIAVHAPSNPSRDHRSSTTLQLMFAAVLLVSSLSTTSFCESTTMVKMHPPLQPLNPGITKSTELPGAIAGVKEGVPADPPPVCVSETLV